MNRNGDAWKNRAFVLAFGVLTFFCWCPLGYGKYGEVPRFLGVPSWAVVAWAVGVAFFILQWVYMFHTRLAMNDDELPGVISQLEKVDVGNALQTKEGQ